MLIDSFIGHTTLLLLAVAMLDLRHALLLLVLARAPHWSRPRWRISVFVRATPVSAALERER